MGLPSMIDKSKKDIFTFIKYRVWKRINSWKCKFLSKAGKKVMIKLILQSIPSYIMSVFLIPDTMMNDIEKMLNSFLWGGGTNNKVIRWMTWEHFFCTKKEGVWVSVISRRLIWLC